MELINNKQVNLWRGDSEPPTKYHIWIKGTLLLLYNGEKWIVFLDDLATDAKIEEIQEIVEKLKGSTINSKKIIDNPVLISSDIEVGKNLNLIKSEDTIQGALEILDNKVNEKSKIKLTPAESGGITINVNDDNFTLSTEGSSLGLRTVEHNNIIISSNALTTIDTDFPLKYEKNKLVHENSGVEAAIYGSNNLHSEVDTFIIPQIKVNNTGHLEEVKDTTITINHIVNQKIENLEDLERPILLSTGNLEENNTGDTIKANQLTFNNLTLKTKFPGDIQLLGGISIEGGDLIVDPKYKIKGNIESSSPSTPKIHSSKSTDYGAASTKLFGHVLLQDELDTIKPLKSNNTEDTALVVIPKDSQAKAASPLLVWNAMEKVEDDFIKKLSDDFELTEDQKIYLKWLNLK